MSTSPTATIDTYITQLIQSPEEFALLSAEWVVLLEKAGLSNISLTHPWLMTFIKHFPPLELFVITVRDHTGQLIGAAPLKISKVPRGLTNRIFRKVQFIGTDPDVYDWMQLICDQQANRTQFLQCIADAIRQYKPKWDIIDLRFCWERDDLETLVAFLSDRFPRFRIESTMSMPYYDLPESAEAYEDITRKRGFKKDLKRVKNHLERDFPEDQLALAFYAPSDNVDAHLAAFFESHIQYWQLRGVKSDFRRYPKLKSFYRDAYYHFYEPDIRNHCQLLFSGLSLGEKVLGYQMVFINGQNALGHIVTYNEQYKKYRPGILHFDALIADAITRGAKVFEFGRGDEPYKSQWAKTKQPLWNLEVYKTPWLAFLAGIDQALRQGLLYLRRLKK